MWEVIQILQQEEEAEGARGLLAENGILVKLNKVSDDKFEILVPSAEVDEAQQLLLS